MPYVKQERRPALDPIVEEFSHIDFKHPYLKLFIFWGLNIHRCEIKYFDQAKKLFIKAKVQPNGDMNYILFKYAKHHINPSYGAYKTFMGEIYEIIDDLQEFRSIEFRAWIDELREAAEWIRIKLLVPYEEKKLLENGDV